MSAASIALLFAAAGVLVLVSMWFAWRARSRRDAAAAASSPAPDGETIARFPRAAYVSTTAEGAPLERIALPGLRYKGYADVTVRRDGVTIEVTGERPVHIGAARVLGTDEAGMRIGKAVEQGGLSLLLWRADDSHGTPEAGDDGRILESSFRFADAAEQRRFSAAIKQILTPAACGAGDRDTHGTTQEDA
ncbi:PH-like domain-containing protein [Leucobacter sp. VD1]|uniref:PH-like domain-containing protein n=1 Tax=Leucobacter sp. VD1 TaxID=3080381 RepID=UPI003019C203